MGRTSSRRPISREPLINFIHRRLEILLALATAIFIFYVTGLPTLNQSNDTPTAIYNHPLSRQDLAQNFLLYIPFGFLASLAGRRLRSNWIKISSVTLFAGLLMSGTAEFLQNYFPGRTSSKIDILCNLSGTLAGLMLTYALKLSGLSYRSFLTKRLRSQPIFMTFVMGTLFYGLLSLAPFQLTLKPKTEATILNPARLAAFTPQKSLETLTSSSDQRARYDHIIDLTSACIIFVFLGYCLGHSLDMEFQFHRLLGLLLVVWIVLMINLILEFIQMFIEHSGFQSAIITVSLAGAIWGLTLSWVFTKSAQLKSWVWGGLICCLGLIGARELNPYHFVWNDTFWFDRWNDMSLIPFKRYLTSSSIHSASSDIVNKLGRFVIFGILLSMCLRRLKIKPFVKRLRMGGWATWGFGITIELLQFAVPERSLDITHILLAGAGGYIGLIADQYWRDLIKTYRPRPSYHVRGAQHSLANSPEAPIALIT